MADEQEKIEKNQEQIDIELARRLVEDKNLWEFLVRKLELPQEQYTVEMVTEKSNDELGELVKADVLAQEKVRMRFSAIKQLAANKPSGRSVVAPR